MMSNPQSAINRRQQMHRRQNSTPVVFEAVKVPTIPYPGSQRQNLHRRRQSLDTRNHMTEQDLTVSNTNTGLTTTGHHILREAQQAKTARPGQDDQQLPSPLSENFLTNEQYFFFSNSNPSTPNGFLNDPTIMGNMTGQFETPEGYPHGIKWTTFEGLAMDVDNLNASQDYFQSSHPAFIGTNENVVNMRRQSQPENASYADRPSTPAHQIQSSYFPLTPSTNSFKNSGQLRQYPATAQSSPTKIHFDHGNMAFQQTPMQRGRSFPGQFRNIDTSELPSPPGTIRLTTGRFDIAPMPEPRSSTAESFPMLASKSSQSQASSHASPKLTASSLASSFQSSPETAPMPYLDSERRPIPRLDKIPVPVLSSSQTMPALSSPTSPTRASLSPRRMSISDLNLEPGISASIEETNITLDDIAQFIEGPDPVDNKWICKYEDCDKRFGRKENIKSHVQTHLGDRQFRCDHCNKCFVRGHDLKRHAKIHTGAKPYPCDCGNSFARHDALTRHRQRGMCIGAFDGVIRKVIKRGRPRKHRPEMDERVDKAARTRRRARERHYHYASPASGSSMSSIHSPPTDTLESLSIRGSSPFNDMALFGAEPADEKAALPPELFSFTPPTSPGYSTGNKPSPVHHGSFAPTDLADIVELPSSPTPLQLPVSHESPPSLCNTSSSPVPESTLAFKFSDDSAGIMPEMGKEIGRTDFDDFFDYGGMGSTDQDFFVE